MFSNCCDGKCLLSTSFRKNIDVVYNVSGIIFFFGCNSINAVKSLLLLMLDVLEWTQGNIAGSFLSCKGNSDTGNPDIASLTFSNFYVFCFLNQGLVLHT